MSKNIVHRVSVDVAMFLTLASSLVSGVVLWLVLPSGRRSGYGLLLIIDHSKGLTTYYGHCSRLLLQQGDRVSRGEVVALMGVSGRTTGSHLHFETRKHGRHFDPFLLMPELRKL